MKNYVNEFIESLREMKGCDPDSGTYLANLIHLAVFVVAAVMGIIVTAASLIDRFLWIL